jgi:tRNA nucleotidyltransferase/poly(A) polymerase
MSQSTDWLICRSANALIQRVIAFIAARGAPAWLVGGYVRDCLLRRSSHDLDVIVPEGGVSLARAVARAFDGAFFVLDDERDVGRAILQPEGDAALKVDVARLRVPDLLGDLALRDFTINAIAVELAADAAGPRVFDPFDGRLDLTRGLLRAVTEGAFRDDPLRMLRGVRHAVELGFRIETATRDLIRQDAPLLPTVAAERVRDELFRIVAAPGAWQHLRLLVTLDLLRYVLPESAAQVGVEQSPPHYQDVFDHTRSVMAHLEGTYALLWPQGNYVRPTAVADDPTVLADAVLWANLAEALAPYAADVRSHLALPLASGHLRRDLLLWAALAHDWGKPAMRSVDATGRIRFLEHDRWGALLAERRGKALRLASDEVAYLALLVDQHMRPGYLAHEYPPSRRAIYRFYRDVGSLGPDCALLSLVDHMAFRAPDPVPERWKQRLGVTQMLLEAYFRERADRVNPEPLLDGRQIMAEFGLEPGPQIGRLLEGLREAQAMGLVTTADQARAWLTGQIGRR